MSQLARGWTKADARLLYDTNTVSKRFVTVFGFFHWFSMQIWSEEAFSQSSLEASSSAQAVSSRDITCPKSDCRDAPSELSLEYNHCPAPMSSLPSSSSLLEVSTLPSTSSLPADSSLPSTSLPAASSIPSTSFLSTPRASSSTTNQGRAAASDVSREIFKQLPECIQAVSV